MRNNNEKYIKKTFTGSSKKCGKLYEKVYCISNTNSYIWYVLILTQSQLNDKKMNEEKVLEVVNGIIIDRLNELVENMSNHDFVEYVMDRLEQEGVKIDTENDDVVEKINGVIGDRIFPLLHKLTEYLIEKTIPTK